MFMIKCSQIFLLCPFRAFFLPLFSEGVALGYYVMPFQGARARARARTVARACANAWQASEWTQGYVSGTGTGTGALKGHNIVAEGNALGRQYQKKYALKGHNKWLSTLSSPSSNVIL